MNTPQDQAEGRWTGVIEVMTMSGPIILGSLSFVIMYFVDTVIVSQLGKSQLAAVTPGGLWAHAVTTPVLGVACCVSTFVSQSLGRGETHKCASYAWQGIHLSIVTGLLAILLWPLAPYLFGVMQHDAEVFSLETLYFRIRLFGFGFVVWQGALGSFFQAVNRPLIPMYVAIVANVLNVVLDLLFVFGFEPLRIPHMGMAGAAWATVISLGVQVAILQLVFLVGKTQREYNTRGMFRVNLTRLWELTRIGVPAGLHMFLDVTTWAIFISFVVGRLGTVPLAANNIAIVFMHLTFMPAIALNNGIAPIVGQWIGRGRPDMAKKRAYTALRIAIIYMFSMGILVALSGSVLIRTFFSDDAEVVRLGRLLLIMVVVFQAFDAINIVLSGALRGAGDTRWLAVITFALSYLLFLPLAFTLSSLLNAGVIGAWLGATAFITVLSFFIFRRFHGEHWKSISIFAEE